MHGEASLEDKGRFVLLGDKKAPRSADDQTFSCPKCASRRGIMLETVYREGSSKGSAPPEKMEVKGWLFLGLGFALALLAPGPRWIGNAFVAIAIAAAVMVALATVYNVRRFPVIRERWEKSAMCSRCGHVVVVQH